MINGEMEKSRGHLSKNYFYIKVEDLVNVYNSDASRELDPDKAETKILVYEDRIKGWFFDPIDEMKEDPSCGFMVVQALVNLLDNNSKMTGVSAASALSRLGLDAGFAAKIKSGNPLGFRFDLSAKAAVKKTETGIVINVARFADAVRLDIEKQLKSPKARSMISKRMKLV